MLSKIKNFITVIMAVGTILVPLGAPLAVSALTQQDINGSICNGSNIQVSTTPDTSGCTGQANGSNLNNFLRNVINIFSAVVGVIAVLMIIVGGFRYITSGGESGKVGTAKNTLIYAIVGLIIVALAQLVVHFVLGQANTIANNTSL